jgi:Na+-translocating ferredoxin:NAD+ oxidoreductase subunit G
MAKKLESTLPNMILSLTTISLVMSAALAFVYLKTKGPIEQAAIQKEKSAIEQVVPKFDNDPSQSVWDTNGITIYTLKAQETVVGYAVKTYTDKGFSGHIELIAGFLPDGSIYNTMVLQHKETPGLGNKMVEPKFKDQFNGKNPASFQLKVKKDGGQVDAITAATISSRAYCDALQKAYNAIQRTDGTTGATK